MRFISLVAVSSLVITLGVFQVSAVQEDAALATMDTPMANLYRRAEAGEGGEGGESGGNEAGSAEKASEEVATADIAEVKESPEVQRAETAGEESNRNEGSAGDRRKAKEASSDENVQAAAAGGVHKAGKHKGGKKHAKAAGGAHKSSKHGGAAKASRGGPREANTGVRVREAAMNTMESDMHRSGNAMPADMGEYSRSRGGRSRQAQRSAYGGGSPRGRRMRSSRSSRRPMRSYDSQSMGSVPAAAPAAPAEAAPAKKKGGLGGGIPILGGLLGGAL